MGMITYGVNDSEKSFQKPISKASYISILKAQRKNALKEIDEYEKAIEQCKAELKRIEVDLFLYSNEEFEKIYAEKGMELTKKDLIIEYYIREIPPEKIAKAVGVSSNYVSKVLSAYRKENGIENGTRGYKTKIRIMQCLSSGMSINQTAHTVEVTPQYVNMVRREFESKQN